MRQRTKPDAQFEKNRIREGVSRDLPVAAGTDRGSDALSNAKTALELRHGIAEKPLTSPGSTGCLPADNLAVSRVRCPTSSWSECPSCPGTGCLNAGFQRSLLRSISVKAVR
jgi:hypothetical protein